MSGLYIRFQMITLVNITGCSPNLVCALIVLRSGLGLLMVKFHEFLIELCVCVRALYSFPDDNFSKYY